MEQAAVCMTALWLSLPEKVWDACNLVLHPYGKDVNKEPCDTCVYQASFGNIKLQRDQEPSGSKVTVRRDTRMQFTAGYA